MPSDCIIIAGAGIVGASIAYHLAKRGADVKVAEASQPGAGATGKSFGWINATFSKRPRAYFNLSLEAIAAWHRLEAELNGAIRVQWGGSVTLALTASQADELRQNVRQHQEWGYATRMLDQDELQRVLPACEVGTAALCEEEGAVDPFETTAALLAKARQFGAELFCPCEIAELDLASRTIHTSQGPMQADTLVLACGVGSPALARTAGVNIPLKESPGVLVHTNPQPHLLDAVVVAPEVHLKQDFNGRVIAGGPVVAGVGTAITNASVDQAGVILEQAGRFLPRLKDAVIEKVTLGHRVMPLDEYPMVGFAADKLYVAVTHSGVTLAPLIGELAAQEILDHVRLDVLEPYRLSRFL